MKKKFFYIAMVALALTGCSDSLSTIDSSEGKADITIPSDAEAGELLIKFAPEMSSILDQAQMSKTRSGKATRSGIPSTDEVLDILGSYSFERVLLSCAWSRISLISGLNLISSSPASASAGMVISELPSEEPMVDRLSEQPVNANATIAI